MFRNKWGMRNVYMEAAGDGGGSGGGSTPPAGGGSTPPAGGAAGGGGAPDFRSMIPAEYQNHTALADVKDVGGLIKSYLHAQSLVGADKIVIPKENSAPEEWDAVYNKLGRPPTADKYVFPDMQLPQGLEKDPATEQWAKELFHKAGLTPRQAALIAEGYNKAAIERFTSGQNQMSQMAQENQAKLRSEWGAKYDTNIAMAKQAVRRLGGDELAKAMDETGLGDHPAMIKAFHNLEKILGEDKGIGERMASNGFPTGQEAAKSEIAQLQSDQTFMKQYMNRDEVGHQQAKERMERLFRAAYPGKVEY